MSSEGFLRRWSRLKGGRDALPCPPSGQDEQRAHRDPGYSPQAGVNLIPHANSNLDTATGREGLEGARAAEPAPAMRTALPTLEDAMHLTAESDYSAFMAQGVDKAARRLAMKKLFADPHFNQLDGLDIYMGDYNRADPLPATMLAALRQARDFIQQAPADEEHAGTEDEAEAGRAGIPSGDEDAGMQARENSEKGEET